MPAPVTTDSGERPAAAPTAGDRWARGGLWTRNLGLVLLLFVAFQLWGTSLGQARSQDRLTRSFTDRLEAGPPPGAASEPLPAAPPGDAVAIVDIPRIGVRQAVVEGTEVGDLRKGPGHYPATSLPGESGNVAIAGHRTTYGAPFGRLDELEAGDVVRLVTSRGRLRYEVLGHKVVNPSDTRALAPSAENRLTLTTCNPRFSATERLVVVARFAPGGDDIAEPAPASVSVDPMPAPSGRQAIGLSGRWSAIVPAVFWTLLVVAAGRATALLARRWVPWLTYLVCAPWVAVLLLELFINVDQVLPAGY